MRTCLCGVLLRRSYLDLLSVKLELFFALRAKAIVALNDLCGSF